MPERWRRAPSDEEIREELIPKIEWRLVGDDRIVFTVPSKRGTTTYTIVVRLSDWAVTDHSGCPAWQKGTRCWHIRAIEMMRPRVEELIRQGYSRGRGSQPLPDEEEAGQGGGEAEVPRYAGLVYSERELELLRDLAEGLARL